MKIKGIDHLVIPASDPDASVKFYTEILGMQLEKGNHLALKFGNQKINLHRRKAEFLPAAVNPAYGSADLCLLVEGEIEAVYGELQEKLVRVESGGVVERTGARGKIRSIYLRDPDGNLIELSSYAK